MILAGFAKRAITPAGSALLSGFDLRKAPSEGVLDDLYVCAMAIVPEDGKPFIFLAFDLLGIPRELALRLYDATAAQCRTVPERVWASATHTHAAPAHVFNRAPETDAPYIESLLSASAAAAKDALSCASPVQALSGFAEKSGIASRRDVPREESRYDMPVFSLLLRGRKDVYLSRFACHCTVLDEKNLLVSADLAGAARQALGSDCALLNGACADLSTRYARVSSTPEEMHRLGSKLAEAIRSTPYVPASGFAERISAKRATVSLPQRALPDPEEILRLKNAFAAKLESCSDASARREITSILAVLSRPARPVDELRQIDISAVCMDSFILIGLPFEVNSDRGAAWETELSVLAGRPVYLVCYTGGYDGYLPSGKPLSEDSCYQDVASRYPPEAVGILENAMKELIQNLPQRSN